MTALPAVKRYWVRRPKTTLLEAIDCDKDCDCQVPCELVVFATDFAAQSDEVWRLREALVTSRKVLVVACGEKAPFVRVALDVIDAALGSQP